MKILRAKDSDNLELTTIMRASKAHWNYTTEQMKKWEAELTISAADIQTKNIYKIIIDRSIIGFYSYVIMDKDNVELEDLFVHPNWIGKGIGKQLLNDFMQRINKQGISSVILDSDPNAKEFYIRMGFRQVGKKPTLIPNRFMPIMKKEL